ncbi:CAP domain-containing protein [Jeotgalibacillus haloalkalitolerans]|uniref:CAP domain-containing protein n=1 Tax=Jeotgalibacillus haloalkalitolerans TaxID=3104292 RepID=A0ABU5KL04_9BACL|nr:CAP domain-containing protein [Jeotgalibacillus sp. HH7-29]MDZ5711934.1 CAP domain-containing protein [Jeotgalibacillus sp. HH7-29]
MFGKVIASAAVAIALLAPSGTASAHWDRDLYQNYIEQIIKQYDIQVYYKDFEKITWKKAAPASAEKMTEPETEVPVEKEPTQPVEQQAAPETNTETEMPVERAEVPAEEVDTPANVTEAPAEENTEPEVEPEVQAPQNEASADELGSFEAQVIELTNQERSKYGLPALQADTELSVVAEEKSADMARNQYFSHTSPTYGSPFDMMKSYGIDYRSAGENIAMGQRTPEQVVTAWMNSEGHRKNILSTSYTHIGVGYVENGNYWTQMFIGK